MQERAIHISSVDRQKIGKSKAEDFIQIQILYLYSGMSKSSIPLYTNLKTNYKTNNY